MLSFQNSILVSKVIISVRILLSLDGKQSAMFHWTDPCARLTGKGDGRGGLVTVTTGRLNIRGADVD